MKHVKMAREGKTDTLGRQLVEGYTKRIQRLDKEMAMISGVEAGTGAGTITNKTAAVKIKEADIFLFNFEKNPAAIKNWQGFIEKGNINKLISSIQGSGKKHIPPIEYTKEDAMNILNRIINMDVADSGPVE
jgi:hypothetical protein